MNSRSVKTYALCSTALIALMQAPQALAQAADAAAEEVVVTGSRIITNGFSQPTPVTVLSMEQMQATAPNSLSDAVNQLPQFRASLTPNTSGFGPGATTNRGASYVNLRGLDPRRGLILLNGERVVASTANAGSAVDLNTLPQNLMRRVDVVTGGASAAYGSDALSGVVNFVLDNKFTGIKGEVRGSITTYGDNEQVGASIAAGRAFAGGRGHVIGSYEYFRSAGIDHYAEGNRDWATSGTAVFTNPACPQPQTSTTCPTRIVTGPLINQTMSSGGLITGASSPALASLIGQTFIGATGSVTMQPFPYATVRTTTQGIGGGIDGLLQNGLNFNPSNWRHNAYVRAEYEVAPNWTVHADALYGWSSNKYLSFLGYNSGLPIGNTTTYPAANQAGYVIFADNPFLPASVAAAMQAAPLGTNALSLYNPATGLFNGPRVNSIVLGRIDTDWPIQYNVATFTTTRFSTGLNGKFNAAGTEWDIAAYGTYGRGGNTSAVPNDPVLSNLYEAVDAVRSPGGPGLAPAGTPICRSTITNPNNACVPLNVIGQRVATDAALNYIFGGPTVNSHFSQVLKQYVGDVAIRGEPFSTWAGPVAVGFGASYRKESVKTEADALSDGYNPAIPGTSVFKPGLTAPLTINGFPGSTVVAGVTGGTGAPRGGIGRFVTANQGSGFPGSLDVKEVFFETLIPLLKDHSFARQLNLNAAFRYADYQYGGGVKNWKIGLVYDTPLEGLRIRSTSSRDVRAPNLNDLFAGRSVSLAGGSDPFRLGTTGTPEGTPGNSIISGNPDLKPEYGDTFTLGAVYSPTFIPGFTLSIDYFHIILRDRIASLSGTTVLQQCFQGNAPLCTLVTRNNDPTSFGPGNTIGPVTQIFLPALNSGYQKMAGLDIEASYNLPLSRFWDGRTDSLNFRLVANYQGKNTSWVVGSTTLSSSVGIVGGGIIQGSGGNYDWGGNLNVAYRNGPLTVNIQERFINSGRINNNVDEDGKPYPANLIINPNPQQSGQVPNVVGAWYWTDVSANYRFGPDERYEAFVNVRNLFDKDPPMIGAQFIPYGVVPTNYSAYENVGRTYTAGLRFRF